MIVKESQENNKSKTTNVCRSFTFYRSYQYSTTSLDMPYVTLGFFNGFNTDRILVENDLLPLWEKSVYLMQDADLEASYQNIFGFCLEDESEDKEFWADEIEENEKFPFTFVILIQLLKCENQKNSSSENKLKLTTIVEKIKKELNEKAKIEVNEYGKKIGLDTDDDFRLTSYVTLDKYDAVICIKSKVYTPIIKSISQITINDLPMRTFTISAVKKMLIASDYEKIKSLLGKQYAQSVCIKAVIENRKDEDDGCGNKVINATQMLNDILREKLYRNDSSEAIREKAKCYTTIGESDVRFIFDNVPLANFFSFIGEVPSLYNKFPAFLKIEAEISALFVASRVERLDGLFDSNQTGPEENSLGIIFSEIDSLIDKICNYCNINRQNYLTQILNKTVRQLQQTFKAMHKSPTRSYDLFHLLNSFRLSLEIVLRDIDYRDNMKEKKISAIYLTNVFKLIEILSSINFVSMRTDIKSYQILNFHVNLYYAPSKLRAMYNVFITDLLRFYKCFGLSNENYLRCDMPDNLYGFLVAPGVYSSTNVRELIGSKSADSSKRLFICEMPERDLYSINSTFALLVHEVSHFGTSAIRFRALRHQCFENIYFRAFIDYIKAWLLNPKQKSQIIDNISAVENGNYKNSDIKDVAAKIFFDVMFDKHVDTELLWAIKRHYRMNEEFIHSQSGHLSGRYIELIHSDPYNNAFMSINSYSHIGSTLFATIMGSKGEALIDELTDIISKHIIARRFPRVEASLPLLYNRLIRGEGGINDWVNQAPNMVKIISSLIRAGSRKIINEMYLPHIDDYRCELSTICGISAYLFKECYADMLMIFGLRLSPNEYIDKFQKLLWRGGNESSDKLFILTVRQAITMSAIKKVLHTDCENCINCKDQGFGSIITSEQTTDFTTIGIQSICKSWSKMRDEWKVNIDVLINEMDESSNKSMYLSEVKKYVEKVFHIFYNTEEPIDPKYCIEFREQLIMQAFKNSGQNIGRNFVLFDKEIWLAYSKYLTECGKAYFETLWKKIYSSKNADVNEHSSSQIDFDFYHYYCRLSDTTDKTEIANIIEEYLICYEERCSSDTP